MITPAKIERIVRTENNTVIVDREDFCWIFNVTLTRKAYDGDSEEKTFYVYSEETEDNDGLIDVTVSEDFVRYIEDRYGRDFYYTIKYKIKTAYYESDMKELK